MAHGTSLLEPSDAKGEGDGKQKHEASHILHAVMNES